MRDFDSYLAAVRQAYSTGGDHRAEIFDTDDVAEPTDRELVNFLGTLLGIVGTETGKLGGAKQQTQVDARSNAIRSLMDFANTAPVTGAFSHLTRNTVCFQLALRVRRPKIIDQDQTTLCGVVALVVDLAKRDPVRYARTAAQLFETGRSKWGNTELAPSLLVRTGFKSLTPQADYIMLASIRDTWAIIIGNETIRDVLTLTKPGALCDFLADAGYTDILDRTFLEMTKALSTLNALTPHSLHGQTHLPGDQGIKSLRQAQVEIEGGRTVVMNAAVDFSRGLKNGAFTKGAAPGPIGAGETHWTLLRKLTIQNNGDVFVRLITWGGAREATIPQDVFLSYYCGYVSANPC
ncbi:MAG: hypothetical protein WBX18_10995 [Terracidiphilus sp.]